MTDKLRRISRSRGVRGNGNNDQLDRKSVESDPITWYGLVWRIGRTAMESNASMIRISIPLVFTCAILLLIAYVGW